MTGAVIGLIAGILLLPPIGLLLGPFIGAYTGEVSGGMDEITALKASSGAVLGVFAGTLAKLSVTILICAVMLWHFIEYLLGSAVIV